MRFSLLSVLAIGLANAYAFRPQHAGTWKFWIALAIPYLALAALGVYRMYDDGTLVDRLKPRWGDLSIGAITAAVLLMASWAGRALLAPSDSPRHAWLLRVYLQIGPTEALQRSIALTTFVLVIPVLEELTWRGLVLNELEEKVGSRRAWPLAAILYAVAHVPTIFALADPVAGPNPLLAFAALGCGLVWGFAASMTKHLPPVIFSHMVFTYFSAVQFRWPGM
jgi:membrane protease YdiL (CAAX protease family)